MKPGKLNSREWIVMKQHPVVGAGLVLTTGASNEIAMAIRHHHERWDGHGYPDRIKGNDIPLISRILAVTDAFDAMTSNRPYRRAMSVYDALAEIQNCAYTQFDLNVVYVFTEMIERGGIFIKDDQNRLGLLENSCLCCNHIGLCNTTSWW